MNKKLHIRCATPYNWYSLRTMIIKDDLGGEYRISPGQGRTFGVNDFPDELSFRMDWFRAKLQLEQCEGDNLYVVLAFTGGSALQLTLRSFTRSAFSFTQLSRHEYESYTVQNTPQELQPAAKESFDWLSVGLLGALCLWAVVAGSFESHTDNFFSALMPAAGTLGLIVLVTLFADRKALNSKVFFFRVLLLCSGLFGLLLFASVYEWTDMGWWLVLIPVFVATRVFSAYRSSVNMWF